MTPMYRADQVGSFLRPPSLLAARADFEAGAITLDQLRQAEDAAIDDILQLQREVGIDVFTDGEFRRANFLSELSASVKGFEPRPIVTTSAFFADTPRTRVVVAGRLQQTRRLAEYEASDMQRRVAEPFKITLPTPFQFVNYMEGVSDQFYASRSELLEHVAQIIGGEVHALVQQGVKYIQIDAPRYSYFLDPNLADEFRNSGTDPRVSLDEVITADNACVGFEHPPDVTLAIHICRGNNRSKWYASGGYDAIAEQLFTSLHADRFLLEYDDERSGGFEPLRFVPRGKVAVLGLVTTKFDTMESEDQLRRRIDEASKYLPLEQLALSPQCGFASMLAGNLISEDTQRRKLELVVETARQVWG